MQHKILNIGQYIKNKTAAFLLIQFHSVVCLRTVVGDACIRPVIRCSRRAKRAPVARRALSTECKSKDGDRPTPSPFCLLRGDIITEASLPSF